MTLRRSLVPLLLLALTGGAAPLAGTGADEPDVVVIQHVLIGFKRSVAGKKLERTKSEARTLALELLERARSDETEFGALVKEYTDDRYPGIMKLTNHDAPRMSGATVRNGVVPRFGDVAFGLEVGEVGLAEYHPGNSPYGWHVIKRLE